MNCAAWALRGLALVIVGTLALLTVPDPAGAQEWPKRRHITIVSPYPPGGTNDVVARLYAERLSVKIGQSVVVENKPGSAGALGSMFVSNAPADGYTLLSANNGAMLIQPLVNPNALYDPLENFTPVTQLAASYVAIGVHPSLPVTNVKEFVAHLKGNAGKLFYGSSGSGSFGHFNGELFRMQYGLDYTHASFRGSAAALTDLMSGQVQFMMDPLVLSQSKSGRVRVLAITNPARLSAFPDIPTIAEAGFPEFSLEGWFGVLGPPGLPKEIVGKLAEVGAELVNDPDVKQKFEVAGILALARSGDGFIKLIADGKKTYADVKAKANIKVDP